jgi:hypothetical protein
VTFGTPILKGEFLSVLQIEIAVFIQLTPSEAKLVLAKHPAE